jgi:hypothetical protein
VVALQRLSRLLAALTLAEGCTEFESPTDVLTGAEVNSLIPAQDSLEWGCLEPGARSTAVPVFAPTVAQVIYSIQVVELSTGQIYPDAQVRACGLADVTCESPVADWVEVDAEGWVHLPLFRDFVGYLEVVATGAVPDVFYLNQPLRESITEYPLTLVPLASIVPLVSLVGVQLQANTGIVAIRAFDCLGNTASGVSLSSSTAGTPYYFIDGLPTGAVSATDGDGLGGLVNVPPGLAVVELEAPTGISIGGPQSLVIRPNSISAIYLRPLTGQRLRVD